MTLTAAMTQFVMASAKFRHHVRHIPSKALLDHQNRNAYYKVTVRDLQMWATWNKVNGRLTR